MTLFNKLNNRVEQEMQEMNPVEKTSMQDLASDISTIIGLGVTPKKKIAEYLEAAVGWVYACVDSISNEVAGIQIKLMKKTAKGEVEEVKESPILDLLARANNNTTKFDLFYLTQQYLDLAGEAPWFLEFKGGKPHNIFLLRPDRLTVKPPKKDGEIIGGYTYKIYKEGVKEITLEPYEVIFLKYPDPVKPFRGKGTLEAAVTTYDMDESAEKFNLQFFNNSATPDSVLSTDKKLSKEVVRKLKRELEQKHTGYTNAHKTLVLEGGLEWKPMALSQKEMDFIETMKFTRDKIMAIFRVPKTVLGITEDVNRANAEASDYVFAKRTIKPKMMKIIEMLNEFLLPLFDDSGTVYLDFEDPVPENDELKLKISTEGVTKGVLTINEARELLGYDPVDGGDDVASPVTPNVEPKIIGTGVRRVKKELINKTAIRANNKRSEVKRKTKALLDTIQREITQKLSPILYSQLLSKVESKKIEADKKEQKVKNIKAFQDSYDGSDKTKKQFQMDQLRIGEEFEKRFITKINVIFREQSKIVTDQLPQKSSKEPLLDLDEEAKKMYKQLRPTVSFVVGTQSKRTMQLLGQDKNRITEYNNEPTAEFLNKRFYNTIHDVNKQTNRIIGKVIAQSIKDEISIPETAKRIKASFVKMEGYRANRIARTEIIKATSFATEETFIVSDVVELKEWLTFIDERTSPQCLAMNGKKLKLGGNYFKKGDTFRGDNFDVNLDYENIAGPPLHTNCRCTLVPVVRA